MPLALAGDFAHKPVVLVQRGWLARNFLDRTSLPPLSTPAGDVWVEGTIALSPHQLYQLGAASTGLIRQNLDLVAFRAETQLPLLALAVQQTNEAQDGLLRDWGVMASGAEKNYAYAFQWFALGALIVILYVWFQIVRRFVFPAQK
jgi:surfeit locus 1 family protein